MAYAGYDKRGRPVAYSGGRIPREPPEEPWYKSLVWRIVIGVTIALIGGGALFWLGWN